MAIRTKLTSKKGKRVSFLAQTSKGPKKVTFIAKQKRKKRKANWQSAGAKALRKKTYKPTKEEKWSIELSCSGALMPRIEKVLKANITPYEKCILIKKHIKDWRTK